MKEENKVSKFILKKKKEGVTKLSVMEIHLATKIPAEIVSKIMERWLKEGRVSEILYAEVK